MPILSNSHGWSSTKSWIRKASQRESGKNSVWNSWIPDKVCTYLIKFIFAFVVFTYRFVHMKPLHGVFMKGNEYFSKWCDAV